MSAFPQEERQARLGPGGLDPLEVIEELPEVRVRVFSSVGACQLMRLSFIASFCAGTSQVLRE